MYAGPGQPEPRPALLSEEEPEPGLHNTLSRFAIDSAERRRVGIGNDVAVDRMIEKVQGFQTQFEIAILGLRQIKPFQNAVVGIEAARVSQIAEVNSLLPPCIMASWATKMLNYLEKRLSR